MTTPNEPQQPTAPEPVWYSPAQLEEIVRAFVEKERAQAATAINDLKVQVESLAKSISGTVPTLIREHGAGNGTATHETWSQWEQELARAAHEAALVAKVAVPVAESVLPHIAGL